MEADPPTQTYRLAQYHREEQHLLEMQRILSNSILRLKYQDALTALRQAHAKLIQSGCWQQDTE